MENRVKNLTGILEKKKVRLTAKRREILEALIDSNNHLKPEELYHLVKNKGIGLATTYRTIELLKKNGIIKEIKIGKERYYELRVFRQRCLHAHLKCNVCGRIYDSADTGLVLNMIKLQKIVKNLYDFETVDLEIIMEGICNNCRR